MAAGDERARTTRSTQRVRVRVVAVLGLVAVVLGLSVPAAAADERYRDRVFSSGQVTVTNGVVFAPADPAAGLDQALRLDLYEPAGDTATDRPVVIWVHGGGFTSGNRGQMAPFATDSARRGYVAASIDYRQLGESLTGLLVALQDARRAVRWFRANASDLGIDPGRISMGGYSAGAVTSLNAAYTPATGTDFGHAQPWDIAAAISFAGASASNVEPGEPPAVFFHGDRDPRVWYDAQPGQPLPGFSAVEVCERARAEGVVCEFHTHVGATHDLSPYRAADLDATARFLSCYVGAPSPFVDTAGTWYGDDADWGAREGLFAPLPGDTFRGRNRLTRGQFVDLLWRLRGRPPAAGPHHFLDVAPDAWFADALDWADEAGVVPAFPGDRFRPHRSVSRGQAVAQLWAVTGRAPGWPPHAFPDVPAGAYPGVALDWAAANDIVAGYPNGRFAKSDRVTRGQVARMVRRIGLTAPAWADDLRAAPPRATCFREGDPTRLG